MQTGNLQSNKCKYIQNILTNKVCVLKVSQDYSYYIQLKKFKNIDILNVYLSHPNGQPIQFDLYTSTDIQKQINDINKSQNHLKHQIYNGVVRSKAKLWSKAQNQQQQILLTHFLYNILNELMQFDTFIRQILFLSGKLSNKKNYKRINKKSHTFIDQQKTLKFKKNIIDIISQKNSDQQTKQINMIDTNQCSNISQIVSLSVIPDKTCKVASGGVSIVQKVDIDNIKYTKNGKIYQKKDTNLVKKIQKQCEECLCCTQGNYCEKVKKKNMQISNRFHQQLKIIKKINERGGYKDYLFQYFINMNNHEQYYLEYADLNLSQFLYYYGQNLEYQQILSICLQIVQIVSDLHQMGVVHRDLKPTNFMVICQHNNLQPKLKLIDFSDSALINQPTQIQIFSTIPYSPLQCSKNNKKYNQQGINRKQIDLWSVGILIHEAFYGFLPISYCTVFSKDIHFLWDNQLLYNPISNRGQSGYKLLKYMLDRIRINMIIPKPQQRISLQKSRKLLLQGIQLIKYLKGKAILSKKTKPSQMICHPVISQKLCGIYSVAPINYNSY